MQYVMKSSLTIITHVHSFVTNVQVCLIYGAEPNIVAQRHTGAFINEGTLNWIVREFPTNMDDLGIPLFQETTMRAVWRFHHVIMGVMIDIGI